MDVPSYMLDKKNWRKKFQFFFIFHRGDPYDFSKKISQKIFLKNHKGPPYEKWKKYEIFFFNFFCPTCSLGHPKMPVRSFFEKSLTNFECVLFVLPRILTTSPFLINEILAIKNAILFFRNRLSRYVFNYRVLHVTLQEKKYIH